MLLSHAHADGDAGLLVHRHIAGVILLADDLISVLLHAVITLKHRDRRCGHHDGAAVAGLQLVFHVDQSSTSYVRTGRIVLESMSSTAVFEAMLHDCVIRIVIISNVDPATVIVKLAQSWFVFLSQFSSVHDGVLSGFDSKLIEMNCVRSSEYLNTINQSRIRLEHVDVLQRRTLIENRVRGG